MEDKNIDLDNLCNTLREIVDRGEFVMIAKTLHETAMEYGTVGHKMEKVSFSTIKEEDFWDFVYTGITMSVCSSPEVWFMKVDGFGEVHDSAVIQINENVSAYVTNRDHKFDKWLGELKEKYGQDGQTFQQLLKK